MCGKRYEIGTEFLHVDRQMSERLGGVEEESRSCGMGRAGHILHGVRNSQDVGQVRGTYDFRFLGKKLLVYGKVEFACGEQGNNGKARAFVLRQHLPGKQVGMMLGQRHDYQVAFAHVARSPSLRH